MSLITFTCDKAVEEKPRMLNVPDCLKTQEISNKAVEVGKCTLLDAPDSLKTQECVLR